MVDAQQLLGVFRRFAAVMTEPFEISNVLYQLGDAAVAVLQADGAGVSLAAAEGRLEFVTATDRTLVELEEVQQARQAGPCVEAFRRREPVVLSDIAAQAPWDAYRAAASSAGFGAVIGMPLLVAEHCLGSINIYQRSPRDWTGDEVDAAAGLATIATAYLVRAGQLESATNLAGQLQRALDSRVVIEQAKGVISRHHGISVGAAFDLLRTYSRSHNRPLRDVADAVVHDQLDIT